MLPESTKLKILTAATTQFALTSPDSFSMRKLAKEVGVVQSVIYYYFGSKEELLRAMFDLINTELGTARAALPVTDTVKDMLEQRVIFQLHHAEEVVAVLKYYLGFRAQFKKGKTGFIPDKAYLHVEEVLQRGVVEGEFDPELDISAEAKVMTHAINGFLLEYYPHLPKGREKQQLVTSITGFLWRGIPKVDPV